MNEFFEKWFGPVETESGYFYTAKAALIVVSALLTCMLGGTVAAIAFEGVSSDRMGTLISCCQAISFIAISVMGYHLGGRGRNKLLKNEAMTDAITDQ